jgi:methylated-DNA-[protein]-cysteine S-methyltransferase
MEKRKKTVYIGELNSSPLGSIWVAVSEHGLVAVETGADREAFVAGLERSGFQSVLDGPDETAGAIRQISEYLHGERKDFDIAIDWSVLTPFQNKVLRATFEIPYGQVRTYGGLAQQVGNPRAARAVGRAEATNPMPLVIPCHRVIGADGGLHGYGSGEGLKTKAWLLALETEI